MRSSVELKERVVTMGTFLLRRSYGFAATKRSDEIGVAKLCDGQREKHGAFRLVSVEMAPARYRKAGQPVGNAILLRG